MEPPPLSSHWAVPPARPQGALGGHRVSVRTLVLLLRNYSESLVNVDAGWEGMDAGG